MNEVTIIIPFYNAEKYISQCMDSLRAQTFRNFHALFIDDGSTDRTVEIIQDAADPRFEILHQSHKGVSAARNLGLAHLTGKYIAFMDVDDELSEDYFEVLVRDIERENVDVVVCNYYEVYATGERKEIVYPWKNQCLTHADIKEKLIPPMVSPDSKQECIRGVVWRTFIRRSFYEKVDIKFDEEIEIAEDLLFLLELYNKLVCLYVESYPLYLYHRYYNSSMNKYRPDSLERSLLFHDKLLSLLKRENLYKDNVDRYRLLRISMYTSEISNIAREKNNEKVVCELKTLRKLLASDQLVLSEVGASLQRKISLWMLKKKLYRLLMLVFKIKENVRLAKFIH